MQVQLKVSDKVTIVADGEKQTEVFENLAAMQEVFGEEKCAKCEGKGGAGLTFGVRKDDEENKYYELRCNDFKCKGKLSFGVNKKGGTLFAHRYQTEKVNGETVKVKVDGKNVVKGKWGWVIYNKETGKEE